MDTAFESSQKLQKKNGDPRFKDRRDSVLEDPYIMKKSTNTCKYNGSQ